jgi:hypothetical protein
MRYSTIKRDSGLLEEYVRGRKSIEKLETAFRELTERGVLLTYKREDVTGPRGKLMDVIFDPQPHSDFVYEAKAANKRQSNDQRKAVGIGAGQRLKMRVFIRLQTSNLLSFDLIFISSLENQTAKTRKASKL